VRGGVEGVERCAHLELGARGAVDECEVDRQAEIVPAAAGDVAVAEQRLTVRPLGPLDHRRRRPRRSVGVEDLQREPVGNEVPLDAPERVCGLASEEGPIGQVPGERRAREIVGRRVAQLDDDRRVDRRDVDEEALGDVRRGDREIVGVDAGRRRGRRRPPRRGACRQGGRGDE
jgi:hypothetical protein